jgi:hypothetical protein
MHVRKVHTNVKEWTTLSSSSGLDIKSRISFLRESALQSAPQEDLNPLLMVKKEDIDCYLNLYWDNFHPTFPVLHRSSFDISENFDDDILLNVVCAIGLHYLDPLPTRRDMTSQAFTFALYKLEHAFNGDFTIRGFQAALIAVYAGLFLGTDEWYKWSINSHFQLVSIARENSMFQHSAESIAGNDWEEFFIVESRKRISYSLYLIDGQMATLLNYPPNLSHYEIKHILPCSDEAWEATNAEQWRKVFKEERLYFLESLQQTLIYGNAPKSMSSFGSVVILLAIHIMIRNMAQYAGILETIQSFAQDPFSRRSQLGQALNGLRELIPRKTKTGETGPLKKMWDLFEATWNLAYIHLHLPDTVITSGIVEVTLNATIATAAALSKPQPLVLPGTALLSNDYTRIPYETYALVANSHVLFFLRSFRLNYKETSPALTFMFYKGSLVAWQILKSACPPSPSRNSTRGDSQKHYMMQRLAYDIMTHIHEHYDVDQPGLGNLEMYEKWIQSLLKSYTTWGIGACASVSFKELLSD